jgi:hypothetical protein
MDVELRKKRRTRLREILADAKNVVKNEFPFVAEETNEYRITVLSLANLIVENDKNLNTS